jgi:hypothetical protein
MARARAWSAEVRAEALRVYVSEGPAAASRQTTVPVGTLHRWAAGAGLRSPASAPEPPTLPAQLDTGPVPSWAGRATDLAGLLGEVADRTLRRVLTQLDQGRPIPPKDAAVLVPMCLEWARRLGHGRDPSGLSQEELQARLNRMIADIEASNVRPIRPKRGRGRQAVQ